LNEILFNRRPRETLTYQSSQNLPLKANLISTLASDKTPLTIQFTDTGTNNPTNWLWIFGDSQFSTTKNPVHKYDIDGKCTVTLTVRNYGGIDSTIITTV
jgi:PKD repeat protein